MLPIMVQGCDSRLGRCTVRPHNPANPRGEGTCSRWAAQQSKRLLISAWHTETAGRFFFEIKGLSA